jgi:hypothetical protein
MSIRLLGPPAHLLHLIDLRARVVTWTIEDGQSDDGCWVVRDLDAL